MANSNHKLIIIAAPSGSGKTSITRYLMKTFPQLAFSISAATRSPRGNEKNGVDYHFMSTEAFKEKIRQNEFVEWEMVYEGKYYGTLKSELENIWKENRIPILDVDVKGAVHVQQQFRETSLSLFIQAPSIAELKKRLESRGTETPESLAARVNKASFELTFGKHFDKTIINDELERACNEAGTIVAEFIKS